MPKHIIEFNLPDEQDDLDMTLNARKYYLTLHEIRDELRVMVKHNSLKIKGKKEMETLLKVSEKIANIFKENDIPADF